MRRTKRKSGFVLCLLINLLLNLEWSIPGLILLGLHFWLDISVWYAVVAFIIWIVLMIIWMLIMGWARKCGNDSDPYKQNKNPYSVRNTEISNEAD